MEGLEVTFDRIPKVRIAYAFIRSKRTAFPFNNIPILRFHPLSAAVVGQEFLDCLRGEACLHHNMAEKF